MTQPSRCALVVDDDPEVRATVAGLLEILGWSITQLEDGQDVARLAQSERPDLILMDVMMPLKSGFQAFQELRQDPTTSPIPVILLSAVNDYELGARHDAASIGRTLGVADPQGFLEKPVNLATLEAAIKAALAGR
jgi:CheY-like chemotaxis protein